MKGGKGKKGKEGKEPGEASEAAQMAVPAAGADALAEDAAGEGDGRRREGDGRPAAEGQAEEQRPPMPNPSDEGNLDGGEAPGNGEAARQSSTRRRGR